MTKVELDNWWCGLTRNQKERIASKAASKQKGEDIVVNYPACTQWWNELPLDKKEWLHEHCTDKHGYLLKEWTEGRSYSY